MMDVRTLFEIIGAITVVVVVMKLLRATFTLLAGFFEAGPKKITVQLTEQESAEHLEGCPKFDPDKLSDPGDKVFLWDPSTFDYLGETKAMNDAEVQECVRKAREAQKIWRTSSFQTRRLLMRTFLRYFTENQEHCARVAVRESGKVRKDIYRHSFSLQ
jgi:delta 1-pyrroline-5-carboxylate dehydrogenase